MDKHDLERAIEQRLADEVKRMGLPDELAKAPSVAVDPHVPTDMIRMRDWFAGMYLCGVVGTQRSPLNVDELAKSAYLQADAMMRQR